MLINKSYFAQNACLQTNKLNITIPLGDCK